MAKVDTDELLNTDDVATMLGLSRRSSVAVYRARYKDFPIPVIDKGRCVLWRRQDVEAWMRSRK